MGCGIVLPAHTCFSTLHRPCAVLSPSLVFSFDTAVPHTMITTSVRGHLASQDFPRAFGWSKCDPVALFHDAPIETSYRDDMVPLEQSLKRLARTAHVLVLWLAG